MTVDELVNKLINLPKDAIVMYRHNKYGRVDIDSVEYAEEPIYSGGYIKAVTFEGSFEEDKKDAVHRIYK